MNKRLVTVGFIILAIALVCRLLIAFGSNIKLDEFHKSSVVVLLETSVQNQSNLPKEIQYIKSLCAVLDPEDDIKILKVANSSYLIYEGSPSDTKGINNSINTYTKYDKTQVGTSYAEAIKKAVGHSLTMKKEGYTPAIIVVGSLNENGAYDKKINWETLPANIRQTKKYIPELAMMFVFAHPEKLDMVKTKLNPVLGEKKLIVASSVNADKSNIKFLKAIGR